LFVKENPYLSFTAVTINFLPYPGWWVWNLGLQFSKTANVNSRISLEVKQQAEHILDNLGIPRAVAIDMFYRQIIAHNGIPFSVTLPTYVPARDEMTNVQFDKMMSVGLEQAKAGNSFDADEVFDEMNF
jgi:addiction module RelB/DinJ family antitoxin